MAEGNEAETQYGGVLQISETNNNRFNEIIKKAREHRYIEGKLPRDAKMDVDGPLQRRYPGQRDYGWSSNGDPSEKEKMKFRNFVMNFGGGVFENALGDSNSDILETRFIFKVPIEESTDVILVDMQAIKIPPDDPRHKSFPATSNKTMVRLSNDDADYLLAEYSKRPEKAEEFYNACFPNLDMVDGDGNSGISRLEQKHLLIIDDINAPGITGEVSLTQRFSINSDLSSFRRYYDVAKQDEKNYLPIQNTTKRQGELILDQPTISPVAPEDKEVTNHVDFGTDVETPDLEDVLKVIVTKGEAFRNTIHKVKDQGLPSRMTNLIDNKRKLGSEFDMLFTVGARDDKNIFLCFSPATTVEGRTRIPYFLTVELSKESADKLKGMIETNPNIARTFFEQEFTDYQTKVLPLPKVGQKVIFVGEDLKVDESAAKLYA